MNTGEILKDVVSEYLRDPLTDVEIGDTVGVHIRIHEGEKSRVQVFMGTVIARKGHGIGESFTVRRLVGGEGVERIFPVHCPSIERVEVHKKGKVRRAKLYYLRDRLGKATKVRERRKAKAKSTEKKA